MPSSVRKANAVLRITNITIQFDDKTRPFSVARLFPRPVDACRANERTRISNFKYRVQFIIFCLYEKKVLWICTKRSISLEHLSRTVNFFIISYVFFT